MNEKNTVSEQEILSILNSKTKPLGSLGKIETLATRVAISQNSTSPICNTCMLLLFVADHGIATENVSAYPQEVTRQMLLNFLAGGAASTVIARKLGIPVRIIDCGVIGEKIESDSVLDYRIASGTNNFLKAPAMTQLQLETAIRNGNEIALNNASDVIAMGEMGIGNTSSAAIVASKLLGEPLTNLIGRGTGLSDMGLNHKLAVLSKASARTSRRLTPYDALREYGGFEIATMVGAMIAAGRSGKLVLVDGYIATAAALCALKLEPRIRKHFVFAHESAETGHSTMLSNLSAEPLLSLQMRLGEGTGALLAWPLISCAVGILNEMASFTSAGVSTAPIHLSQAHIKYTPDTEVIDNVFA